MASITLENSYQSTNRDMGDNHVKAHAKQHKYLQKDEPLIETLTSNQTSDDSVHLALDFAQKNLGLKTPSEWLKYNSKLPKKRQKDNYTAYLLGISGNFQKGKERRLNNPKTNKKTREKIGRELHSIITNGGVPIDGNLYYLSNTEIYDSMTPEQLQTYRQFERKTFKKFYNSDVFQTLNPECIRAEIHYDENGAIHLQTQDTWFHKDKLDRISYAKRAIIKDTLQKWYKSYSADGAEELQHRLDVLCEFEEIATKNGKKPGTRRADAMYNNYIQNYPLGEVDNTLKRNNDGTYRKYAHSNAERNKRIDELWRIEQMTALREIAESTAKSMGINYHVSENYETDGLHLDGAAYIAHKKASQQSRTAMSLANQVSNASQDAVNTLKSSYKAITGENTDEKSPLSISKKIKSAVTAQQKKSEDYQSKIENQEKQLQSQEEKLTRQRNELRAIPHQQQKLQEANNQLKKDNEALENQLETLQLRVKSAGLIISKWFQKNWQKLEKHLRNYAQNINNAERERLYGGKNRNGDIYKSREYEKQAKNGLIAGLTAVENDELKKSGFYENVVHDNTHTNYKEDDQKEL